MFGLGHKTSWWKAEVMIQVDLGYLYEEPLEIEWGELMMIEV